MKTKRPRAYLAGRMNRHIEFHSKWRDEITPFLTKMGFVVLNPYKLEPLQLKGLRPGRLPKGYKHWCELGDSDDPNLQERFKKYGRRIARFDINLVKKEMDIMVVVWDDDSPTGAGTQSEVTTAMMYDKTVYMVDMTKSVTIPLWIRWCVDDTFKSFDALKRFLSEEFGDSGELTEGIPTDENDSDSTKSESAIEITGKP